MNLLFSSFAENVFDRLNREDHLQDAHKVWLQGAIQRAQLKIRIERPFESGLPGRSGEYNPFQIEDSRLLNRWGQVVHS